MSSPRPHSSKRLCRGILFLWVTAVIEAQAMEDLGEHLQANSELGGASNLLPRKLATFLMRPVKRGLDSQALLNRVTRSVEDTESEVGDLEDSQDLAFEARDTRKGRARADS